MITKAGILLNRIREEDGTLSQLGAIPSVGFRPMVKPKGPNLDFSDRVRRLIHKLRAEKALTFSSDSVTAFSGGEEVGD